MVGVSNTGELRASSDGAAVPTEEALKNTLFLCHLAYNGDQNTKSAVVDAADDACYAMGYLLDHMPVPACQTFDKSIKKLAAAPGNDPLVSEAKGLSERLSQRLTSIDCATQLAITRAAEDRAKAVLQAATPPPAPANPYAKRNAIVGEINGENQSLDSSLEVAQRWFDRGKDYEACGYYQKALASLRRLETLYADLNRETGDSDYSAKSSQDEGSAGRRARGLSRHVPGGRTTPVLRPLRHNKDRQGKVVSAISATTGPSPPPGPETRARK